MRVFYPPTEDQLKILNYFYGNWNHSLLLWILRGLSLLALVLALVFWYRIINNKLGKEVAMVSSMMVFLTPTFHILWLLHPGDCLKILLIIGLFYVFLFRLRLKMLVTSVILMIVVIVFSLAIMKEKSSFVYSFRLSEAQQELTDRFGTEDSLINPIKIPLLVKRIAYNKYFFYYKRVINEIIPFFDLETVFFQEIHPMEQKSVVLFVWPEIILFLIGIYRLVWLKNKDLSQIVLVFLGIALMNYLMVASEPYRKFELVLFPVSLLMSLVVNLRFIFKINLLNRWILGVILVFSVYGIFTNFIDLKRRPDFWLDNRPLFYDFIYQNLSNFDLSKYKLITVSSLVGNPKDYCNFYIGNCGETRFQFNSFNLRDTEPEGNSIYAGFVGEFVGSDIKNNISSDWPGIVKSRGMQILATENLRDTIAYQYGNDVLITKANDEKK